MLPGEDAAVEISTELQLDETRIAVSFAPPVGEEGLQILADDCVQDGGLGLSPGRSARKDSRSQSGADGAGASRNRRLRSALEGPDRYLESWSMRLMTANG